MNKNQIENDFDFLCLVVIGLIIVKAIT